MALLHALRAALGAAEARYIGSGSDYDRGVVDGLRAAYSVAYEASGAPLTGKESQ